MINDYINAIYWPPMAVVAALVILVAVYELILRPMLRRRRGNKMPEWEKDKKAKQIISDAFVTGIEEARYKGLITRHQKAHYYAMFADAMDLKDLRPYNPEARKAEIKGRLHQNGKPVNIPGDKPIQELVPNKYPTNRLSAMLFRKSQP